LSDERLAVCFQRVRQLAKSNSRRRQLETRCILGGERFDDRIVWHRTPIDTPTLDHARTDTTDDQPPYPLVRACEDQRDDRTHRVADKIDSRYSDHVEEDSEVARHAILPVACGVVRLLRSAVAPSVRSYNPSSGGSKRIDDTRGEEVGVRISNEAMM